MFVTSEKVTVAILVTTLVVSLSAYPNWSEWDRNTTIDAGTGTLGGTAPTDGSTLGTLGGAAVGSVIGHRVGE